MAAGATSRQLSIRLQLGLFIALHVLVWTWVGVSSRSNFDQPGDMVEAYAWAQGWQWGYYKHPPLSAWVAGLWFSVVPESHLGYSLLAALNSAVGLAGLAVLARQFLPARWVLLTVAMASLAPGITTLAMRFNANSVLISSWPWALALTVRLMRHGRARDAVLCGLVCAAAMLGKYFSGVLLLSMLITALWLPTWRAQFRHGAVWLAIVVFGLAMAPHVAWLAAQTHGPLQYAQAATEKAPASASALRALHFALVQGVFPLLATLALYRALAGPRRGRAFFDAATAVLRPRADALWLLAVLPIVATAVATLLTSARTASVWGLAMAAGLALLAVSRAFEAGAGLNLRRLWQTMAAVWLTVAVLSPAWWYACAKAQAPGVSAPRQELAQAAQALWREHTGQPLRWVAGTRVLAASTAFYASDHPRYWSVFDPTLETPWVPTDEVRRQGGLIVCAEDDHLCQQLAETWTAQQQVVTVAKRSRGMQFAPQRHLVFLIRPQ